MSNPFISNPFIFWEKMRGSDSEEHYKRNYYEVSGICQLKDLSEIHNVHDFENLKEAQDYFMAGLDEKIASLTREKEELEEIFESYNDLVDSRICPCCDENLRDTGCLYCSDCRKIDGEWYGEECQCSLCEQERKTSGGSDGK